MGKIEAKNRLQSLIQFGLVIVLLILINWLANSRIGGLPLYTAFDLTKDKRFTLTDNTYAQIEALEEPIFVRILLDGELPAAYERLGQSVREMLEDFRSRNKLVEFEFSDPLVGSAETIQQRQKKLAEEHGIRPVTLVEQRANQREVQAVYPFAILYYSGRTQVVNLLEKPVPGIPNDVIVNKANSLLEYKFSNAIQKLVTSARPIIAFTTGHGELPPVRVADLLQELVRKQQFEVGPLSLDSVTYIDQRIEVLIVAKPTRGFSDKEAFKLDQYVMNGGKILWCIDPIGVGLDSLRGRNEYFPEPYDLGELETLFFRYGFRINQDMVLDLLNSRIPITTSMVNGNPQIERFPFPYHVMSIPNGDHPIIKNLDPIDLRFPASIDLSVEEEGQLKKTVLLTTSDNARYQRLPSAIDLDMQKYSLERDRFDKSDLVLGALLEGTFTSPFANRLSSENKAVLDQLGQSYRAESVPTRMVVVADGDLLSNSISPDGEPRPLGYNAFEDYQFDNKTFAVNAIEYLLDDKGVITARGKELRLRMLNPERAVAETTKWRVVNIVLPLVFLLLFGLAYTFIRRRRFSK